MINQKYLHHFKNLLKNPIRLVLIIGIFILLVFIILNFSKKISVNEAPEISAIKSTQNLKMQNEAYTKLIERVGPTSAQEQLFRSGLPFDGQTHLLNHTVGNYLYKKYGPAGLVECRDYFLSSCHHGFILNAIADGGMPLVTKTFEECSKYGKPVSAQCAHGMGHGFLANVGYKNLTQALKTCDEAERAMSGFPVFNCYDGVFMENIWAVHDGKPSPDRWVKESDIIYPCNDSRIDKKYTLACWSNQPSLAYQFFKGDIKRVADEVCMNIKNLEYQRMCFDGLARQIHPITNGQYKKTFDLCNLMPSKEWTNFCLVINASSAYAVGDHESPFKICSDMSKESKPNCFDRVFSFMNIYKRPKESLKNLCSLISDLDWRTKCEGRFKEQPRE